ncbi:MAG: methionyl-tRNA formyltransferase [Eubacteriales bacterium]|nr:methionyl-tRNA formyltransferase [Eubacteriales bacterium]
MRIAFLGTPEFAVPSLQMLIDAGHTLLVVTQPDRPQGRHATLTPPPVKVLAEKHGIPVFQCEKIRLPEGVEALRAFRPELMVTAAFGQILSKENLDIPTHGCINVHGSLLPKYRGAAPIQWAVINGEHVTGVTTMLTDVGLDTGDILLTEETPIQPEETAGELYCRLADIGAGLLKKTIVALEAGTLTPTPQNEAAATKCGMLKKEHGKLDFSLPAQRLHNLVRGVNPWPGAYALLNGEPLKIWKIRTAPEALPPKDAPLGMLFGGVKQGLFVTCADGALEILELQAAGGKRVQAKVYLMGKPIVGSVLT